MTMEPPPVLNHKNPTVRSVNEVPSALPELGLDVLVARGPGVPRAGGFVELPRLLRIDVATEMMNNWLIQIVAGFDQSQIKGYI